MVDIGCRIKVTNINYLINVGDLSHRVVILEGLERKTFGNPFLNSWHLSGLAPCMLPLASAVSRNILIPLSSHLSHAGGQITAVASPEAAHSPFLCSFMVPGSSVQLWVGVVVLSL